MFLLSPGFRPPWGSPGARRSGFSLLELLVVIAVIGVLAALLFPTIGAARRSAQAARTKVQFTQWAAAIESFRGEYGYYPAFDSSGLVNGGAAADPAGEHVFHDVLAGRRRDGSALVAGGPLTAGAQNRRQIAFHTFTDAELAPADDPHPFLVRDGSGRPDIAVLVDRNLDGFIRVGPGGDYPALPRVAGLAPAADEFPATGVRGGVAFYAPAPGATLADPRLVLSWK